jgi:hypothetical protein
MSVSSAAADRGQRKQAAIRKSARKLLCETNAGVDRRRAADWALNVSWRAERRVTYRPACELAPWRQATAERMPTL